MATSWLGSRLKRQERPPASLPFVRHRGHDRYSNGNEGATKTRSSPGTRLHDKRARMSANWMPSGRGLPFTLDSSGDGARPGARSPSAAGRRWRVEIRVDMVRRAVSPLPACTLSSRNWVRPRGLNERRRTGRQTSREKQCLIRQPLITENCSSMPAGA